MDNKQTANIIKVLAKEKGTNPTNVFQKIGISKNFIHNLIKQGSKPSVESIEKLADYFNVSIDYLIGRTEQPTKIEQNVSHNTLNDQSIGINNVQNIENSISKELLTEFEKLSFKDKSYIMSMIAELNEPTKNDAKIVASPSRVDIPPTSKEDIEIAKQLMKQIDENKSK